MIVKTIELENGQTLVISDLSRSISENACIVVMKAHMDIRIGKELFSDTPLSDFKYQDILGILGPRVVYEYKIERNLIKNPEKAGVFDKIVETYLKNMGQYVARPNFPGKFILKEYKNRIK